MHDWHNGTTNMVSMAVPSDGSEGSYNVEKGLFFSFPVRINDVTKEWEIVTGLATDGFEEQKTAMEKVSFPCFYQLIYA